MKGSRFAGTEWSNERQSLECQTGEALRAFKAQITQYPEADMGPESRSPPLGVEFS